MTIFRKKLIINIGVILTIFVLATGILYVIVDKLNTTNAEILVLKNKVHTAQVEIKEYSGLKSDSIKADAAIAIIHKAIPLRDDLFTVRTQIEKLASARGLRSGFSFGAETQSANGALGYVGFDMSIEGALSNELLFVKDVENIGYLIVLDQSSMNRAGNDIAGRLDGRIFFTE